MAGACTLAAIEACSSNSASSDSPDSTGGTGAGGTGTGGKLGKGGSGAVTTTVGGSGSATTTTTGGKSPSTSVGGAAGIKATGGAAGTPTTGGTGAVPPAGGGTGAVTTTSGGRSSGTGSTTSTGVGGTSSLAATCKDNFGNAVTVPAGNMISDFANGTLYQIVQKGRGDKAEPWKAFSADDTAGPPVVPGPGNPQAAANKFAVDATTSGPCSVGGSLHVSSPGGEGSSFWGVGFGVDFMARATGDKKQSYDASAYTGVGFWAKCTKDLPFAYLKVLDAAEDGDTATAPCKYGDPKVDTTCNQYGVKNAVLTKEWTYYKLYFNELLQDPDSARFGTGIDKSKLTSFQVLINKQSNRAGTLTANPFDCYIDDVHFLSDPAPTVPTEKVTYTTSGNTISRNGTPYRIRGLVRPSMEWDLSGFGVTREDIQRMKQWKANTIRLAVSDTYWNATTGSGPAYRRNVKRVVSWILEEGLDVILDLHYVGKVPNDTNKEFWNLISKDTFFQNGRIIFELYNEPNDIGFDALQDWSQKTVNAIRANGATNLILVSGTDYTYNISGYETKPITGGGAIGYVTHPYTFKGDPGDAKAFLNLAKTLPVVATEFGDANIGGHSISPTACDANLYSKYITTFEDNKVNWTSWAWIVDEWGCGFPQLLADYSGEPNAIGTPVKAALTSLNK